MVDINTFTTECLAVLRCNMLLLLLLLYFQFLTGCVYWSYSKTSAVLVVTEIGRVN